jgi:hypothetical protein
MSSRNPEERVKVNVIDGANAGNMTLAGITTDDLLVQVIDVNGTSSAEVAFHNGTSTPDSSVVISDDDTLDTDLDLSSKKLMVVWLDRDAG